MYLLKHLFGPKKRSHPHRLTRARTLLFSLAFALGFCLPARAQDFLERPPFFDRGRDRLNEEIDRLQQPQSDAISILDIETDADSPQWSAVVLREGSGAIWMPQGVTIQDVETVETADGSIDFDVIFTVSAIGQFAAAFSEKMDAFVAADPTALLDRVRAHIASDREGFEVTSDRAITFNDYPGREFVLQNDEEVITFRVLLVGDRLYVLAVNQSVDARQEEAIATFFDSFQPL